MKRLLLQAAKSPLFLRRPEGRRFLAHVLTLHPSLVAEMASVMRNMVGPWGRGQKREGRVGAAGVRPGKGRGRAASGRQRARKRLDPQAPPHHTLTLFPRPGRDRQAVGAGGGRRDHPARLARGGGPVPRGDRGDTHPGGGGGVEVLPGGVRLGSLVGKGVACGRPQPSPPITSAAVPSPLPPPLRAPAPRSPGLCARLPPRVLQGPRLQRPRRAAPAPRGQAPGAGRGGRRCDERAGRRAGAPVRAAAVQVGFCGGL
jgi:hypothetical protein